MTVRSLAVVVENHKEVAIPSVRVQREYSYDADFLYTPLLCSKVCTCVAKKCMDERWIFNRQKKKISSCSLRCLSFVVGFYVFSLFRMGISYCPGRPSLKIAFFRLDRGGRRGQRSRHQTAPGATSCRKHATSSWANSRIGFRFSSPKISSTSSFVYFSRSIQISFFPRSDHRMMCVSTNRIQTRFILFSRFVFFLNRFKLALGGYSPIAFRIKHSESNLPCQTPR